MTVRRANVMSGPTTGLRLVGQKDERPIKVKIASTEHGIAIVDAVTLRPIEGIMRVFMELLPGTMKLEITLAPNAAALVIEGEANVFQPPAHLILEDGSSFVPRDGDVMPLINNATPNITAMSPRRTVNLLLRSKRATASDFEASSASYGVQAELRLVH